MSLSCSSSSENSSFLRRPKEGIRKLDGFDGMEGGLDGAFGGVVGGLLGGVGGLLGGVGGLN